MLKNAKPPQSYISKNERVTLTSIKKDKDIIVLPADTGRATVVMNVLEYESKVKDKLSDEKLSTDPTASYNRKSVATITRFKGRRKPRRGNLYPTAVGMPRMYYTPKIHLDHWSTYWGH